MKGMRLDEALKQEALATEAERTCSILIMEPHEDCWCRCRVSHAVATPKRSAMARAILLHDPFWWQTSPRWITSS